MSSKHPPLRKMSTIRDDDPFSNIFMQAKQKSGNVRTHSSDVRLINNDLAGLNKQVKFQRDEDSFEDSDVEMKEDDNDTNSLGDFFPNFDGTKDSKEYEPELIHTNAGQLQNWKDAAYYRLPENVRKAIDVAKLKSHHTEFWYKLQNLNDKLHVYKGLFMTKMPAHQQAYYEKKQKEMEERLREEKKKAEAEMKKMSKNAKKIKRQ